MESEITELNGQDQRAVDALKFNRRAFIAKSAVLAAATVGSQFGEMLHAAKALVGAMPNIEKLGWRVGFATYTFRNVSVFESIDKIAATGLSYAELFAWQKLSPTNPKATIEGGLSKTLRQDLKNKAVDSGVKIIGMYSRFKDAEMTKAAFEFAAEMEFEVIVGEPKEQMMDLVESLTKEFGVSLALHNHAKPSSYWNPDTGLGALKGRAESMGFCSDTGHWCRSGLDPVKMLQKVDKRVKTFHLKDFADFGKIESEDVILGQGKCRIREILTEIKRLNIEKPYFSVEWEGDPATSLKTHAASIQFFEQVAGELIGV